MSKKRIAIILGVLLLILVHPVIMELSHGVENQEITVVFRYDDYSTHSNTSCEVKLIDTFQRYDIPCTVGIIPYLTSGDVHDAGSQERIPLSEEKAQILKTAMASGIIEPALHGYSHQTIQDCSGATRKCTEFSGLSYEKQLEKIVEGKKLLEDNLDTEITIFIPPWNSYDRNTLKCLEKLDFNCISTDLRIAPEGNTTLTFVPAITTISELRQAVNSARHSSDPHPVIVVCIHSYDFAEISADRGETTNQEFFDLISWISTQKDVRVTSMSQLTEENDFDASRVKENRGYHSFIHLIPPFLVRSMHLDGVYFSSLYLSPLMNIGIYSIVLSFTLLILLTSALITFFIGTPLFQRFPALGTFCQYFFPVLFVFLLIYVFKNLSIGYLGLIALTFTFGMNLGVWKYVVHIKKSDSRKI
jgi:peptidoglycan/xylan/chitin deacetylase (PgdA/CDA1 family)